MPGTHAIASGTRRPLYVAVHEAGHAVAEWLLGGRAHAVHIPTGGRLPQDRKGRDVHADGFCEATFNYTLYNLLQGVPTHVQARQTDPEMLRNTRRYGLACSVVALAGGCAEARYRHVAYWWVCFTGAAYDIRHVENISLDLFAEEEQQLAFRHTALILMRRLMRGRLPAIVRIAQMLHVRGSLYDDDLHCVLTAELGEMPKYLAAIDE